MLGFSIGSPRNRLPSLVTTITTVTTTPGRTHRTRHLSPSSLWQFYRTTRPLRPHPSFRRRALGSSTTTSSTDPTIWVGSTASHYNTQMPLPYFAHSNIIPWIRYLDSPEWVPPPQN